MKFSPVIAPVVLSAALIFTGGLAAPSASAAVPASARPTWDCDTEGVRQCVNRHLADAWESFDAMVKAPSYSHTHALRYQKMVHRLPSDRRGVVFVKSIAHAKTWYVFKYFTPKHHG